MDFDNLDLLLSDIYSTVDTEVTPKLTEEVETVVQEESEHSYGDYSPLNSDSSRYRRGASGSFADSENYRTEINKKGNDVELTTYNDRVSDCTCSYCASNDTFLDYYVENGIAGITNITKKPVFERSIERIQGEQLVENIVKSTLGRKYDVE